MGWLARLHTLTPVADSRPRALPTEPVLVGRLAEGFAEFYSLMVSKHVDGEPSPERYRIRGAEYDVELDQLAWGWGGWWRS